MFAAFLSTVCGSLLSICVTALSAFSVTIIFRTSTTANFAQGSIAAFGCYVVAECLNRWGVPVYLGVLPGMIVGVVIGLFIDLMVFRKGRHVGELGKQIITMGFVSLFYGGIPLVFGNPEFIPFESFYNTTKAGVESNVVLRAFGGEMENRKKLLIPLFENPDFIGAMRRLTDSSESYDLRDRLDQVRCPTLVVSCQEDYLTPLKEQEYLAAHIKDCHHVILPNCGHASMYEQPALFASLIAGFAGLPQAKFDI